MTRIPGSRKEAWEKMMKESLCDAVIEVLKSHKPEKLTMERVAEAAGVSKGTLYNYFRNKEELILYVVAKTFEPLLERLEELVHASQTPVEKIETFVRMALSLPDTHGQLFRAILESEEGLTPKVYHEGAERRMRVVSAISRIIDEGIQAGGFRKTNSMKAAAMILGAVIGRNMLRFQSGESETSDEAAGEFMEIFIHGLVAGGGPGEVKE